MSEQIPDWPEKPADSAFWVAKHAYERARADAAIARLKLAVEALNGIKDQERFDEDGIYYRMACVADLIEFADNAISKIGPISE
jgi:hypothetical protein